MGLYCLNMIAIGLELAPRNHVYEHLGIGFFEHFMHIAAAINGEIDEGRALWNKTDGWYYDVVHGMSRNDASEQLAVRSQVGLIPLFAAMVLDHCWVGQLPAFIARYEWLITTRPELCGGLACIWTPNGARCIMSIVNFNRLQRLLARTLDESEFLSPFEIRPCLVITETIPTRLPRATAIGRSVTSRPNPPRASSGTIAIGVVPFGCQ